MGALVTYNDHPIIIAGGGRYGYDNGSTSETFDENENKNWGKIDKIPIAGSRLWGHSAVVLGDKVYTFGGDNGNLVNTLDRVDYWKQRKT